VDTNVDVDDASFSACFSRFLAKKSEASKISLSCSPAEEEETSYPALVAAAVIRSLSRSMGVKSDDRSSSSNINCSWANSLAARSLADSLVGVVIVEEGCDGASVVVVDSGVILRLRRLCFSAFRSDVWRLLFGVDVMGDLERWSDGGAWNADEADSASRNAIGGDLIIVALLHCRWLAVFAFDLNCSAGEMGNDNKMNCAEVGEVEVTRVKSSTNRIF
jgi:hypothetical protein